MIVLPFADKFLPFCGYLRQTLSINVSDDWYDEAVVKGHCHSHMDIFKEHNAVVRPLGVDDGVVADRGSCDFHQDVGNSDPDACLLLNLRERFGTVLEYLACIHRIGHISLGCLGLAPQHLLRNRPSHAREGDSLMDWNPLSLRGNVGDLFVPYFIRLLHVFLDNHPPRPCARYVLEIDVVKPSHLLRQWRGLYPRPLDSTGLFARSSFLGSHHLLNRDRRFRRTYRWQL